MAAEKTSRLVLGTVGTGAFVETIRVPADVTQESHVSGLPLGTRGGTVEEIFFPVDGEYRFEFRLARDRNENVEGLNRTHQMEFLIDNIHQATFEIKAKKGPELELIDGNLHVEVFVKSGKHRVGVTFVKQTDRLLENLRQPYQARYNMHRHPRTSPALFQISIAGPYAPPSETSGYSRGRLLEDDVTTSFDDDTSVRQFLLRVMRFAYRRPVSEADLVIPWRVFQEELSAKTPRRKALEASLASILVNPHFLFRVEAALAPGKPSDITRISNLALASRMSFFLWSSLPDDELLLAAEAETLSEPKELEKQVQRMLADERSKALVENFAGQWLYLQNLEALTPDLRSFPDFDDNLRQAFRHETELCFEQVVRNNRSLLQLIKADETFLNERLAKHYGIPHIYGDHFRKVSLDESSHRGGLLRHGSILTATSYATRTSPVLRGHWVLKNLLGMAPPPPPPDVPALKENTISNELTVRERLAQHRDNAVCASCHQLMDPIGMTLEKFDAIGRWRETESGRPIDTSSIIPGGSKLDGVDSLENYLLDRPELFVTTFVEKLMTYGLGRGIEAADMPAVRKIVRESQSDNYRIASLIRGIIESIPFTHRSSQ